ncbi:MAG: hypothetical protein DMG97_42560 [Acidobacteria bacterium]|nr:MAG: hypothetical protein DMG97_42560 [Acidobacteriota bacterium]
MPSRDGLELVEWVFSHSGSLGEISPACRGNSPQARTAASSSRKAVSFQSARTTKRFPLSRCASAIQIVRPLESIAETQPQLQPALLRFPAALLIVAEHWRCKFADFKLCAHLLVPSPIGRPSNRG